VFRGGASIPNPLCSNGRPAAEPHGLPKETYIGDFIVPNPVLAPSGPAYRRFPWSAETNQANFPKWQKSAEESVFSLVSDKRGYLYQITPA
jgi:hypothetical protein